MPKKTKPMTKQAKGWETRRAKADRMAANIASLNMAPQPMSLEAPLFSKRKLDRLGIAMGVGKMTGEAMPIGEKASLTNEEFIADALVVAKKDMTKAKQMLVDRIHSQRADGIDDAFRHHRRVMDDTRVRRRDQAISDFLLMAEVNPSMRVTMIGSITFEAIREVLAEAGYTAHGRGNRATDMAAQGTVGR